MPDDRKMIEKIREMTASELTDWLFEFGLNCVGKGKGEIYRMLVNGGEHDDKRNHRCGKSS